MRENEIEIDGFTFRRRSRPELEPPSVVLTEASIPSSKALEQLDHEPNDAQESRAENLQAAEVSAKVDNAKITKGPRGGGLQVAAMSRVTSAEGKKSTNRKRKRPARKDTRKRQTLPSIVEGVLRAEYEKAALAGIPAYELKALEHAITDVVVGAGDVVSEFEFLRKHYESLVERESCLLAIDQELTTELSEWRRVQVESQNFADIAVTSSPPCSPIAVRERPSIAQLSSPRAVEMLAISTHGINDALKALNRQNEDHASIVSAIARELSQRVW